MRNVPTTPKTIPRAATPRRPQRSVHFLTPPHLVELEVLKEPGLVSLIELTEPYANHSDANTDDQDLAQRP
jgi:hypothetical protein